MRFKCRVFGFQEVLCRNEVKYEDCIKICHRLKGSQPLLFPSSALPCTARACMRTSQIPYPAPFLTQANSGSLAILEAGGTCATSTYHKTATTQNLAKLYSACELTGSSLSDFTFFQESFVYLCLPLPPYVHQQRHHLWIILNSSPLILDSEKHSLWLLFAQRKKLRPGLKFLPTAVWPHKACSYKALALDQVLSTMWST